MTGSAFAPPASGPRRSLRYPLLPPARAPLMDRAALRLSRFGPIWCPVCGSWSTAVGFGPDLASLRESGRCTRCAATNRQRQLALVLCRFLTGRLDRAVRSLRDVPASADLRLLNTEAAGPIHDQLRHLPGYVCSEYLGADVAPGSLVDGVRHEDVTRLSFGDESLDVVLTSDVLEHVPSPYRAHAEIGRVLAPDGRHLFTVPFHQNGYHDEIRAELDADGHLVHHAEPMYHHDPLRPDDGVLVFTIFGLEMLVRLRDLGFQTSLYQLRSVRHGIVGQNGVLFEAVKCDWGWA